MGPVRRAGTPCVRFEFSGSGQQRRPDVAAWTQQRKKTHLFPLPDIPQRPRREFLPLPGDDSVRDPCIGVVYEIQQRQHDRPVRALVVGQVKRIRRHDGRQVPELF